MSMSHRYRNFGQNRPPSATAENSSMEAVEDQKLQSFEAGYKAGWDDAVKAQKESTEAIAAELGQNLQDMSFSYHEALSKLASSMEPIMQEIIEKLLPEVVKHALGAHILEQLKSLTRNDAQLPVEIVVSLANVSVVENLAGSSLVSPFKVIGDPELGEGQAFVRLGDSEQQIDLDGVVEGVSHAMTAFFHETDKEPSDE